MTELQKQLRYFRGYKILPIIFACLVFSPFFVYGIVDSTIVNTLAATFGVMNLPDAFLCWFVWTSIGAVNSVITFFVWRIIFSYHLLHIYYMQKLTDSNDIILKDSNDTKDNNENPSNSSTDSSDGSPYSSIYTKSKN